MQAYRLTRWLIRGFLLAMCIVSLLIPLVSDRRSIEVFPFFPWALFSRAAVESKDFGLLLVLSNGETCWVESCQGLPDLVRRKRFYFLIQRLGAQFLSESYQTHSKDEFLGLEKLVIESLNHHEPEQHPELSGAHEPGSGSKPSIAPYIRVELHRRHFESAQAMLRRGDGVERSDRLHELDWKVK